MNPNSNSSLFIIGTIGTIATASLMLLPLLVGSYIDYLGFSEAAAGRIAAINVAGTAIMALIASLKIRHWDLEKVSVYALVAMIVFDVMGLYFQTILTFSILRFLSGMAGGAVMATISAALARTEHPDKSFGISTGLQFLIPAFGLYFFPKLLPNIGFNGMMITLIVFDILVLLMVPILKKYPVPASADEKGKLGEKSIYALLLQRTAFLSLVGFCIYGVANGGVWAYVERFGYIAGMSGEGIGGVIGISNILALIGVAMVIWLQDKFGHVRPLSAGVFLQFIAMLILIYVPTSAGYIAGVILFQVGWAFAWPYFLSIQADIDPTGSVVVAGSFVNMMGNSAGPLLAAFFVGSNSNYQAAIWMCAAVFIITLLPMLMIYKNKTHKLSISTV